MRRAYIIFAAAALSACGRSPRQLYVDVRFSGAEIEDIRSAVDEVNKLACLIGEDKLIEIAGEFRDDDGHFDQSNIDDGEDQLYRIGSAGECSDYTEHFQSKFGDIGNLYGFYTGTDTGILVFNLNQPNRPPLRHVIMHELGHYVGMEHVTGNSWAVMAPTGYGPRSFTQADKEEFCLRQGCDPD